ncbi:hypothetical protein [Bacillus thuringiensis]|uniref:hypothetical protein n=1 Tax=Bacillus thuringiensis TaxID=1428 RepID=UPI0024BD594A|nr:hypothetical protein [Bacillus thuringiensis]
MEQKRFMLFAFNKSFPSGGFDDFLFAFSTVAEFEVKMNEWIQKFDFYHIVDTKDLKQHEIYDEGDVNGWYGDSSASTELLKEKLSKLLKKL